MRILGCTTAGAGHLGPMVPVLRACERAGHEVLVACPASFVPQVEEVGLAATPFGEPDPDDLRAVMAPLPGMPPDEANRVVVRDVFGRLDASAALAELDGTMGAWRPDVVVRDPSEFASLLLAGHRGVPAVRVSISLLASDVAFGDAALEALGAVADDHGLRAPAHPSDGPVLAAAPASFDPPGSLDPATVHRHGGPLGPRDVPAAVPPGDEPLVYVTFGTVAPSLGVWPGLYRTVVDALADLPVRVLVTTGSGVDVDDLGPVPAGTAVVPFVPQDDVLAHAAVMVAHGGFGTVLGALRAGVPMILAPLFADQPYNAARVAEVGAGVIVETTNDPGVVPPGLADEVLRGVTRMLADDDVRGRAGAFAQEMASQPDLASLVARLATIATPPAPAGPAVAGQPAPPSG